MSFWNETREAVLMKLRSEGLSHHAIAVRMSEETGERVTDGMVQSALRRVSGTKQFREPAHEQTWTAERTETLKKRWAEGLSASHIAEELGVGRGAVLSKKDRLGLPGRLTTTSVMRSRSPASLVRKAPTTPAKRKKTTGVLESVPASILDIKFTGQCKWPLQRADVIGGYLFCGGTTEEGCSYCGVHSRRSTGEVTLSLRRAAA